MNRLKKALFSFFVTIAVSAIPSLSASAQELPYVSTVFNERNGLPTGEANDILQTSEGYIWVGSYGGLIRYDGTDFLNFSTEGILPSSSVRMLYEDSIGRLWIGTNDAGVFVYEDNAISQPEGQPKDTFLCVRGFAEDEDGTIYACSNSGIAEIDGGVMTVYDISGISGQTIYSLGVDRLGRVWGAASDGGCVILSEGEMIYRADAEEFLGSGMSVYSLTSGRDGEIWLGSASNTLARLTFNGEGFNDGDISVTLYETGSVTTHNSLRMMDDGALAVSGLHGFGVLYPDASFREFSESEGAVSVNSAFIDYEGNIWLASTTKGIIRYSVGCFSSPNDIAQLSGTALNTVVIDDEGCYIGTDGGLLIREKDWSPRENELTELLDGIRIRHIIADGKGRIWIASYSDTPIVRYDPQKNEIVTYSSADGLSDDRARVLLELSDGRIAAGMQGGLCLIGESGVDEAYTGMTYPSILSLLETESGSILAGSDGGGIYEIRDGEILSHSFSEGLSEGVVLRMLRDTKGSGYFISAGSSLYYWENGLFKKLDALKKEAGSIFDFYLDDNALWLLQNNGILATDREDLLNGGNGNPTTYSFQHGLSGSLNANTWHCLYNGTLYLATRNGISLFDFRAPENTLPRGIINRVTVDGKVYEHPEEITVEGSTQRITVDFAALSFTDTTRFTVSYRLVGFDEEPTVLSDVKSGSVSYTNLPGGNYRFYLKLADYDDPTVNSILSFTVTKQKQFYELSIFWIGIGLILVILAAGAAMLISGAKLRSARRRQREYRDILEQSLLTFAGTIDAKDKYTNGHSTRVAQYSRELARRMGMNEQQQEHIYYVALLHDIGKIGIPDNILNKPGKLTPEEREIIQRHPKIGADILKNFTALDGIADGAKFHHERYDGTGYCEGRAGEEIPLMARIIGVADTYDAMSSERCYRKPLSVEVIESELKNGIGTQFDPQIIPHMLAMIEDGTAPIRAEKSADAE
ncbi:MAG: HD domain-containing protein [Bacteroides sp.]|nr:HD domain-containing protein [Eubacterium sp.]MCM1417174.1 HD domain-containing protein [Roseburia sp.]MCM1461205.1 HD domain-containing protein [Bacteroides sp.]